MDGAAVERERTGLYDRDIVAWADHQAGCLRARRGADLDWDHLADAVETLVRGQVSMAKAAVMGVIEHLLTLEYSPAGDPRRTWQDSVSHHRALAALQLDDLPGGADRLDLPRVYVRARDLAARGLATYGETAAAAALPQTCPYTLDQILDQDWIPANRHGLV